MTAPAPWTDSPWKVEGGRKTPHYLFVYGLRGQSVAMIFDRHGGKEGERDANADLIRAAPELWNAVDGLLEILSELEGEGVQLDPDQIERQRRAEAAFDKALGNG